jgi:hypothetical protein
MRLRLLLTCVMLGMGLSGAAEAHPDHKHAPARAALDEQGAKDRAKREVDRLIAVKKIDDSWSTSSLKALEKKHLKRGWEWLATFENPAAAKDKILYIFLKPSGEFVAANFTGR